MFGAVDIGGTKTLVGIFNHEGKLINSIKFETPSEYSNFKSKLEKVFIDLGNHDLKMTCVALPGKIDRIRGIGIAFGNLNWVNVPVRKDLELIFKCPIILENDAKLAGLYEATSLGKEYKKVLYITISTGIGGGLIVNDRIDKDFEDIEPGQMLLEHEGKLKRWENFASGKAIYLEYHQKASEIKNEKTWSRIAHNIALGLIDLIANLTPNIIIIGGGVGAHLEKFQDKLVEDLKIYQNPLLEIPPIIKAKNPEEAVIYGCYLNSLRKYEIINN
jgi:glucokinase